MSKFVVHNNYCMNIAYREYLPAEALRPYIDCYWYETIGGDRDEICDLQTCIPLGMAEFIIQVNQQGTIGLLENKWQHFPEAYLVGIKKSPVCWKAPGGSAIFGARLKPEGLIRLFKRPLADFTDGYVEASAFMGSAITPIVSRIQQAPDVAAMLDIMENYFLGLLRNMHCENNYFFEALRLIRQSEGNISIEHLSRKLFVCERQLQRVFKENLGLSPKAYHRIIRFSRAYHSIFQHQEINWAAIANGYHYADQAHLIRDFKAFCGKTPVELLDGHKPGRQVLAH